MIIQPIVTAERLTRYFGRKCVFHDLSMELPAGQVTALLGANGAGKTTLLRIMMGLLSPTRGACRVYGENTSDMSPETRMRIGYLVEGHYLPPSMRVRQCADFQCSGYASWDQSLFTDIVRYFGVDSSSRVGDLSRGQRAGVALALVLAPEPELLVLDDPSLGLDPVSRRCLNETLVEISGNQQRTVLLSTHLLDDVERIADRVVVMTKGALKVDASLDEFRSRVTCFSVEVDAVDAKQIAAIPGLIEARQLGGKLSLTIADADEETEAMVGRLSDGKIDCHESSFYDSVLAYLGRERTATTFYETHHLGV